MWEEGALAAAATAFGHIPTVVQTTQLEVLHVFPQSKKNYSSPVPQFSCPTGSEVQGLDVRASC